MEKYEYDHRSHIDIRVSYIHLKDVAIIHNIVLDPDKVTNWSTEMWLSMC